MLMRTAKLSKNLSLTLHILPQLSKQGRAVPLCSFRSPPSGVSPSFCLLVKPPQAPHTPYIFVDDKDTAHAMPYTKVQYRVTAMIYDKDLRDDNGELFGFSTHIYRHYYGVKLTEMHLDDWTIAKLLGHSSVRNVKYYRKMSNQLLADETRKARQKLSAIILNNLDGWEDEYEQIRKDGRL